MDFQTGVRARLLAAGPVAAIVGTRIDWVERPQNSALPAISLQTVSDPRPLHLKGVDGARSTRVQCDCWAATYAAALALARVAIATLSPPATISGKKFGHAQVDGQRDLGENVGGAGSSYSSGTFIHRQSVDFIIWHVGD